ncbi:MAG: YicC/YloC family endoribonuclease [Planctomycetota bacterium]
MTGFGAATSDDAAIRVELRSVNHRHLHVKSRVPSEFGALEPELEKRLKRRLERGAVSLSIHRARTSVGNGPSIDHDQARRAHAELVRLAAELGIDPPGLGVVLGVPGVVTHREDPPDAKELAALVALVEEATDHLLAMRESEGAALERDLVLHASRLEKITARVERRAPKLVREHQRALAARVGDLLGGAELSDADLAREIALLADKLDVSEELARLKSHQEQLAKLLAKGGAIGRKLEFLIQELLREVNTIGSKANDAQVAQWIVEAKTHVERLREQAANVE